MIEIEIPIQKILLLSDAINGTDSAESIMDRDLSMTERFWLNHLNSQIQHITGAVANLKDDIIRRRGKPDSEGFVQIKATEPAEIEINGTKKVVVVYTPEFIQFEKEYGELMNEKFKIVVNEIMLDMFGEYF